MAKKKEWREGEMIVTFNLTKIDKTLTPCMEDWLSASMPVFDVIEEGYFQKILQKTTKIANWSEEDLKMKFISYILDLAYLMEDINFVSFFDKKLEGTVQGYNLSVKTDFVIAKGMLEFMQKPYFHFQEYKPQKNPTGDPMAQLLEAFLIGKEKNNDSKPLYGCEVNGALWRFVTMEGNAYCVSSLYDSSQKTDLLQIIAILRKFRTILDVRLLE
ncbi:MAG: hypothetical protein RLZZ292_2031 [Bacteroidota bacterium]|jgi:hypothetical protein